MAVIFLNTLRGHRWPLLVMAVLVAGLGILIVAGYEAIGPQASPQAADFLRQQMPRGVSALLKTEGNLLLAAGAEGFIAVGFRHPLFLIVLSAFAIATASGGLAREIERRTVLLLLARPLPRYSLVLSKGMESALGLVALAAALVAGAFVGVVTQGLTESVRAGPLLLMGFNALCLALAVMGYSYLFSALSSDGGRATTFAAALTLLFFFVDFIAGLFDVMEPLGLVSIFHYHDPAAIVTSPSFPGLHIGILLAVAAVTFGAAVLVFQRRDIAV